MFARDTFTSTYTGPFLASGESLFRAKSDAAANRAFAGNERAYRETDKGSKRGIRAGSKQDAYRAGLQADAQGAAAGDYQSVGLARLLDDAKSRLAFQTSVAEEQEGLRRLLFDTDQTRNIAENALRKDIAYQSLSQRQRNADRRMGEMNRDTSIFGWLGGLIS